MFDLTGPHADIMKAANVPPSFVIIQRINLGLYAVLGELRRHRQLAPRRRGALALRRRPPLDPPGRARGGVAGGDGPLIPRSARLR